MNRTLVSLSLATTLSFVAIVVVLLFLAPEVDPLRAGISFYALTPYGSRIGLALALVGVSGIALAIALWTAPRSTAGRAGLLLLAAWGLTSILAGLFPLDAPGAGPSLSGSIHNAAGLNFLLVAPAVLLIELDRTRIEDSSGARPITFRLAWLLLASAALLFIFNGPLQSLGIGGAIQRLYWLALTLWLLFKAAHALRAAAPAAVA